MTSVDALLELIESRYGLKPMPHFESTLSRRVSELSRKKKLKPEALVAVARNTEALLRELVVPLCVPESYFYRHHEHLDYLVKAVQKKFESAPYDASFNIWSAGCSDGQEPYSIAVACVEKLSILETSRIKIVASDLNPSAVERAKKAVYNNWSFRGLNKDLIKRYFTALPEGQFALKQTIQRMVEFRCSSIQEEAASFSEHTVDAIFMRNVSIYLNHEQQDAIYDRFRDVLTTDGMLFVAPSDQMPRRDFFRRLTDAKTSVYFAVPRSPRNTQPPSSGTKRPTIEIEERTVEDAAMKQTPARRTKTSPSEKKMLVPYVDDIVIDFYIGRGQRHLERDEVDDAVEDFRRAVFSQPEDLLSKFWYALSLQRSGVPNRAMVQLNNLRTVLSSLPPDTLLSDGQTTAVELLRAATELRERLT